MELLFYDPVTVNKPYTAYIDKLTKTDVQCCVQKQFLMSDVPLGSGGGMRPNRTFSCSSFCPSLRVCLLNFFCSFLVRYTPRVTGLSVSTETQINNPSLNKLPCAKLKHLAFCDLQQYKYLVGPSEMGAQPKW